MPKTPELEKIQNAEMLILWTCFGKDPKNRKTKRLTEAEKLELYERVIKHIENGGRPI